MALALLLALVTHSLAQPGGPGGPPPPQPTDVTVFATLSLTGPLAEDAQEALRGLQLATSLSLPSSEDLRLHLEVHDDEGDAEVLRGLYEAALPRIETEYLVFLGPLTASLSALAANLTDPQGALLLLPFAPPPAQGSPPGVFSLEIPSQRLLALQLEQLAQRGAQSVAVWSESGHLEVCQAVVAEASRLGMELVFERDAASDLFLIEQMRALAGASPDVVVVCGSVEFEVEVMMALDYIHFNPNAILMSDVSSSELYETLLVSSGLQLLGVDLFSERHEPCGGCFLSRGDFFQRFRGLYGHAPGLVAARAAAAALAVTHYVAEAFEGFGTLEELSALMMSSIEKESFFQPLSFDSQGYLRTATVEVTQLSVLNLTTTGARRLQPVGPPVPVDIAPPITVEPITTEELLNFARLQPVLRGVYTVAPVTGEVVAYRSVSEIAYPRPPEQQRKVLLYPCDEGFEVRSEELWAMLAALARNASSPVSPCAPCDKGAFRSVRSSICSSCPAGTQSTTLGQATCTACLQGAVCDARDATLVVAPGFHYEYGLLLPCAVEGRCLGENQCLGNSVGALCQQCAAGFVSSPKRAASMPDPCIACDAAWAEEWTRMARDAGIYIGLYLLLMLAHWSACVSLMSTSVFTLRAAVNHLQFIAITMKAAEKSWLQENLGISYAYFSGIATLFLDPMQNFPIECLISTWRKYEVKALLGLCLLPTVFLTVAVVAVLWEFIFNPLLLLLFPRHEEAVEVDAGGEKMAFKLKGKSVHHSASFGVLAATPSVHRCLARIAESSFIWCHLLLPLAVYNMLEVLQCVDPQQLAVATVSYPRPIQVQVSDYGQLCGSDAHSLWTVLCILGIVLYGGGIPAGMVGLIQSLSSHSWQSHRAFGYILDGASSDCCYIQVIIIFFSVCCLAFAASFQSELLRMVGLISVYAVYCLLLSQVVPFDARDDMVLLRLELLSMYVLLVLGVAFVVKSPWNPLLYGAPGEVVELPLLTAHGLFVFAVLKQLLTNVVLKRIRYVAAVEELTPPQLLLYQILDVESDKVKLDVATGLLDISGLTRSSRQTLQETLKLALERYFLAAAEGVIPWKQVCDSSQAEDEEDVDPARQGQLHLGFLTAAIYESLVEVEASRVLRQLYDAKSRKKDGCLSKFFQADEREPTVDMQSIQGAFDHRSQVRRGDVERHIKEKSQLVATSEEMYIAMTLLLGSIMSGHKELYDLRKKGVKSREEDVAEEDRPLEEILEEMSTKQDFEGSDSSHEAFELPEAPEAPAADDRPVPLLLRPSGEPLVDEKDPRAVLARALGLRSACGARDQLLELHLDHDRTFEEIIELKAQIQLLQRGLLEARAELAKLERGGEKAPERAGSSPAMQQMAVLKGLGLVWESRVAGQPQRPGQSPSASPRTARQIRGRDTVTPYATDTPGPRSVPQYPVERWPRSQRPVPVAANLEESTRPVGENSFWSKAAT